MVLNILAPKCLILTNYIRCNCKNSKCKWTRIESHVHQHNFIIAIDDSIIPFHKLVRMDGMFGALSGLLSLNSHPFFPLWEEKQFGASWWRLLSFLLEEEVLGNREGSVATSVMPQSFPLCALRGNFVSLNSRGGLGKAAVRFRPNACTVVVFVLTQWSVTYVQELTAGSLNSWNIFCCG